MNDKIATIPGYISTDLSWPDVPRTKKQEGLISFEVADADSIYDAPAFFNPVMVINRDLALLFTKVYSIQMQLQLRIFEPLAGIGVRAFRLAKEVPDAVEEVVISDFNPVTVAIAQTNIRELGIQNKVHLFQREARSLAYDLSEARLKYHFVDLDPFGSPAPFIDSIWSLLSYRAMVAVTATDMTALCGVYPDACMRKYGGYPLNNHHTHDTATRLLIGLVVRSAARMEKGVKPVFSVSVDHYTKVFFTVRASRGAANEATAQLGFSFTCQICHQIYYIGINQERPSCCGELDQAGPLWVGSLFDSDWSKQARQTLDIIELPSRKKLMKFLNEGIDVLELKGYYQISSLCKKYGIPQPSFADLIEAIENKGYRAVRTNFTDQAIRSDIPGTELGVLLKELVT